MDLNQHLADQIYMKVPSASPPSCKLVPNVFIHKYQTITQSLEIALIVIDLDSVVIF